MYVYVSRLCAQNCGGDVTVCRWIRVCMYAYMYVRNMHANIVMYVYVSRHRAQYWRSAVTVCRWIYVLEFVCMYVCM